MGRIIRNIVVVIIWLVITNSPGGARYAYADEADIFLANLKPNVLLILDNSNSMDEDFVGNAICSWATGSRAVEGRRQLLNVVNANANNMRIGLMSFRLPASSKMHLHNSPYYVSYNHNSYCPNPSADCVAYCKAYTGPGYPGCPTCQTLHDSCNASCQADNVHFDADYSLASASNGNDWLAFTPTGVATFPVSAVSTDPRNRYCDLVYPKTNRIENPTDAGKYVYYKLPGTDYEAANQGNSFCYATTYAADDKTYPSTPYDVFSCNHTKTGTNDTSANYSNNYYNGTFQPTDEDTALGFNEFGIRMFGYHTGQTWEANTSPGDGYLHVAAADNLANNVQRDALTAKLAMHENDEAGYMSCGNTGNPNACTYIVDAALTPTAGTFRSAFNYFQGVPDYQSAIANTSPIQAWCQKSFIIYVTDGLPSVNDSGTKGSAASLMPAVLSNIDALRTLTTTAVPGYTFDINTYVLGMALTDQSKVQLDAMAVHGGTDIGGHAYYADNPTQLAAALAAIPQDIISRTYSFATSSVASSRITDENFLYEASFIPVNSDPFWRGYLKQYNINADGTLGSVNWEAGANLAGRDFSLRTFKTSSN